jgi:DNA-binding NtrC family response regulator
VDARVVAATNRLLQNEVREGRFREDLFFRLSVVRVELPPLRDRPEDVLLLAYHFAEPFASDPAELISEEIATLLRSHHWPGNARELRNAIEQISIAPEQGKRSLQDPRPTGAPTPETEIEALIDLPFHEARQRWQDRFEARYLKQHLERAGGVVARAAGQIDLPRQTVHRLLKKHGLRE